ncbi:MAG: FlgD immunoglobulin-like domain containing protein [Verrucomicrobiota bacterium]
MKQRTRTVLGAIIAVSIAATTAMKTSANVYPTNIKINGNITNAVNTPQGSAVTISYILNEAATVGVTLSILSGENLVRSISIPSGIGTSKGTNSVVWDGKATGGSNVSVGTYSVKVSAAATGYTDWTQISDDNFTNSYAFRPRSIAVNRNTNSPYYGRILIGNTTPTGDTNLVGHAQGIIKCNADGSYAEEGAFSRAGYPWIDDGGDSPIQMKIKEDDRAYFNDWVGKGTVVAIDMQATTNQIVIDPTGYSQNPYVLTTTSYNWFNFEIWNAGTTNARIFLCDNGFPSAGIWWWNMTNGAADPSDMAGTQAVSTGGDLSLRADGVLIDANTNVYVFQNRGNVGDANMRAAMFPAWDGQTTLSTGAQWIVGGGDNNFRNLYAFALDSMDHPKMLAYAMSAAGTAAPDGAVAGGIRILNATNGQTIVTNLTFNTYYRSVNWDNAGNLYAGSQTLSRWRVFSPPGTNEATTVALATVNVSAATTSLKLGNVTVSGGNVTIQFSSDVADIAGSFTVQRSLTVDGTYADVAAAITQTGPGAFEAVIPTSGSLGFYRIRK